MCHDLKSAILELSSNSDGNEAIYRWFTLVRQYNIPVTGAMLREEARVVAAWLGQHQFKAFNGWLGELREMSQH